MDYTMECMEPLSLSIISGLIGIIGFGVTHQEEISIAQGVATLIDRTADEPHLLFVGDIMLDRLVSKRAKEKGDQSLFRNVEEYFRDSAVVGNLEGSISGQPSVAELNYSDLRFTFDTRFAPYLNSLGFTALSLANNHSDDFGATGLASTRKALLSANMSHFGSPANSRHLSTQVSIAGRTVCLIGYHAVYNATSGPIVRNLEALEGNCDRRIVYAHWGDEYVPHASEKQKKWAHEFVDAGADAVIGAHPHVVQEMEIYRGRPIFYSLGNFMFDQDFSEETRRGLMVRLTPGESRDVYTLIPTYLTDAAVSPAPLIHAKKVLDRLTNNLHLENGTASRLVAKRTLIVPRSSLPGYHRSIVVMKLNHGNVWR